MEKFPEVTWGLFLGLMVGSVVVVGRMVKDRQWTLRSMMICATMLAYYITISTPVETSESPGMFFFSGMIAIVAMILPGISGSFLLLIMGKYMQVMGAIKGLGSSVKDVLKALLSSDMVTVHQGLYDIQTTAVDIVIPFALGCAIGLGAFSWILTWLLSNYRQMVISILLGLMIGTLHKLWPFREVTLYLHREGKANKVLQDVAVMPYWDEPMHWMALGMIVLGFFIVLGVERLGSSKA
jgi:putative membrane protein